jgi:hypothetical protein
MLDTGAEIPADTNLPQALEENAGKQAGTEGEPGRGIRVLPNNFIDCQGGGARLLLDVAASFLEPRQTGVKFFPVMFGQARTGRLGEFLGALNYQHEVIHQFFQGRIF